MKTRNYLLWIAFFLTIPMNSQNLKDLDYISPFHEGFAAVKKNKTWGFIDESGKQVINFRSDIIPKEKDYPFFQNGRCLIRKVVDGIVYYGYINPTGKTAISPQFVNATSFDKGKAIALKVSKEFLGTNHLLAKNVVSYNYMKLLLILTASC